MELGSKSRQLVGLFWFRFKGTASLLRWWGEEFSSECQRKENLNPEGFKKIKELGKNSDRKPDEHLRVMKRDGVTGINEGNNGKD